MSTFIQTLRQDLISLRWYLPFWLASLALLIVIGRMDLPTEVSTSAQTIKLLFILLVIGSGVGVFGGLLFGHTAADDRSAWHTRPLRRSSVGIEKIVMVALLLVLPLSLVNVFGTGAEISFSAVWREWQERLPLVAAIFMGLTYVGVACRTSSQLLVASLGLLMSGALILKAGSWLNERYAWLTLNDAGTTLAWAIFWIGACSLVIRQYAKPHLGRHVGGAALIVATIALLSVVLPDPWRNLPDVTTNVHYAGVRSLAPIPPDHPTSRLARLRATAEANYTRRLHFRPTTPWMMQVKFEGFDPAYVWQPTVFAKDLGISVQRGQIHPESPYFPTDTLLRAVGLADYTSPPTATAPLFDLRLELAGPPDQPVTALPATATYGFVVHRLTAERLLAAPAREGKHTVDASSLTLQRIRSDDGSEWAQIAVRVDAGGALATQLHGVRAAHLALIATHEPTRRAVLASASLPPRYDPETDTMQQSFIMEPWEGVRWEEMTVVVVKLKPDARVTTDRVNAPN